MENIQLTFTRSLFMLIVFKWGGIILKNIQFSFICIAPADVDAKV